MATTRTLIGVDIGTQGTKAALFSDEGECLAESFRSSSLRQPKPGVVEEDPEDQFGSVCETVRACVRDSGMNPSSVVGIGIDGQMAGVIGVGKDGKHVTHYDSWLDTRCAPYIEKMERTAGDEVVAKTGCIPSFNHGPKKLWWMHERKGVYRRIAAFVQPGGYAAMRLCGLDGKQAFVDRTYLHFSGFADNRRTKWDTALCRTFGLDVEKLPAIVSSETVVGEVLPSVARTCGLKPGVPVVAGCGDTAASFLACGATDVGICVDVAGTASVFAGTTDEFRADKKYRTLVCGKSAVPDLWHPYAYINGGGMNLDWFRREFVNAGKTSGGGRISFDRMNDMAADITARSDLPLFIPHLGGRVCPSQPHLRGAWVGLTWGHSAAHLYRAVLEGVALEYVMYKKVMTELCTEARLNELRVTGGGAKSALWNAIKADALQMPVRTVARSEGAPLGAALVAGFGVGLFPTLQSAAKRWIDAGTTTRPRKSMAAHYSNRAERYEALLRRLNGI